jgi:hypothetical protein
MQNQIEPFFLLLIAPEGDGSKSSPAIPSLPFLSIAVLASREGGEPRFSFVCVLVLEYLGFRVSSVNVMVGRMFMMLVGIVVSQPMLLFVGGDAGAGKESVEPKMLEWLRSRVALWRGGMDVRLLECGGPNCCMFVKEGGGSGRQKGGVALAPNLVLKKLEGLLRPMFFIGLDPALRDWWLPRLVNAQCQ